MARSCLRCSGCTPFGGSSEHNDAYRDYPLYIGYIVQGTGGLVCSSSFGVFSTGVSIAPTSTGLAGVSAPFQSSPPAPAQRTTPQSRSMAWFLNGTFGVNVTGGEYGQNRSDVELGAIAAGGDPYFDAEVRGFGSGSELQCSTPAGGLRRLFRIVSRRVSFLYLPSCFCFGGFRLIQLLAPCS